MEIELIHEFTEFDFPFFEILDVVTVKLFGFKLWTHKLDTVRGSKDFFLSFGFRPEYLENGVKGDNKAFTGLTVFGMMVEETFRSEYEDDRL